VQTHNKKLCRHNQK